VIFSRVCDFAFSLVPLSLKLYNDPSANAFSASVEPIANATCNKDEQCNNETKQY
jgi:hypothetical protein